MITGEETVKEVLDKYGYDGQEILMAHGLHCVGCHFNALDTLKNGFLLHGKTREQFNAVLEDLNKLSEGKQSK